jgi:hypothetical protein
MTDDPDVVALGRIDPSHRHQVEAMAAYGIPEREIARVLGVPPAELRATFPDELDTGAAKANSRVAENLYRKAIGDGREAVVAAIFWLKTRAKWRETTVNEITGPDGMAPINEIVVRIVEPGEDVSKLPPVGVYGPDGVPLGQIGPNLRK